MSTPLKALIQERLRAKIVRQGPNHDLDDGHEHDPNRMIRQSMELPAYELSSREARGDLSSHGPKARRNSAATTNYPMRLHTHIDPSAYLVPSEYDGSYYPPPGAYEASNSRHSDHGRHRNSRYPREQHHETNLYGPSPRHDQQQFQTQNHHHHHHHPRVHEQQQTHYEAALREEYGVSQSNQNRDQISPWYRPEHIPSKARPMTRSPVAGVTRPMHSSPRGQSNRDYTDNFDNSYTRHQQPDAKHALLSPESVNSKTTRIKADSHQPQHYSAYQHMHYARRDREHPYSNPAAVYEVRGPSPTHHHRNHDHNQCTIHDAVRYSVERRRHSNQAGSGSISIHPAKAPSPAKILPKEIIPSEKIDSLCPIERQVPPVLSMDIIEPVPQPPSRIRAWDAILSPESRLAAKAFVEKRQRRADKGTPRTMATQRWLAVLDARATNGAETKQ